MRGTFLKKHKQGRRLSETQGSKGPYGNGVTEILQMFYCKIVISYYLM